MSDPSSFTILKPNDNKLPFIIQLGDIHQTIKGQCRVCECQTNPLYQDEYELSLDCCLHSFNPAFLKAIDNFGSEDRSVDIYIEGMREMNPCKYFSFI